MLNPYIHTNSVYCKQCSTLSLTCSLPNSTWMGSHSLWVKNVDPPKIRPVILFKQISRISIESFIWINRIHNFRSYQSHQHKHRQLYYIWSDKQYIVAILANGLLKWLTNINRQKSKIWLTSSTQFRSLTKASPRTEALQFPSPHPLLRPVQIPSASTVRTSTGQ